MSLTRPTLERLIASAPVAGREQAFDLFERLPVPTGADESWRYVDHELDPDSLQLPTEQGPLLAPDSILEALSPSARAVLIDGIAVRVDGAHLTSGLEFLDLIPASTDKFAAAHRAFASSGVVVSIPAGKATTAPILIEVQCTAAGTISFPHVTVLVGDNAEAEVIVALRSGEALDAVTVPQIEVDLSTSGRLRLLTVQELSTSTSGIVQHRARLGRDSTYRMGEVGLGALLGRLDLAVDLEGQGSSADMVGLFFGHRQQTLDYRMVLNHRGRKTTSAVLLKGAVEDAAQSVFSGLVRIEREAFGASAFETNRNLVLSPDAKAHSVPNLEILCDDVICGHASSVGPLEEEHLYYLQSRGLTGPRAERLLVRGFFNEVLDRLPLRGMESALAEILDRRFLQKGEQAS